MIGSTPIWGNFFKDFTHAPTWTRGAALLPLSSGNTIEKCLVTSRGWCLGHMHMRRSITFTGNFKISLNTYLGDHFLLQKCHQFHFVSLYFLHKSTHPPSNTNKGNSNTEQILCSHEGEISLWKPDRPKKLDHPVLFLLIFANSENRSFFIHKASSCVRSCTYE